MLTNSQTPHIPLLYPNRVALVFTALITLGLTGCGASNTDDTTDEQVEINEPESTTDNNNESDQSDDTIHKTDDAEDVEIEERVVWRGNDYLDQPDWKQQWGLVGWNEELGILTNGYWGYDETELVADPYDPEHKVLRVFYEYEGVATESGAGMLFMPTVELKDSSKACLSYNFLFDHDFDFGVTGGKLPGLYGFKENSGVNLDSTVCLGPYDYDSSTCFSARYGYRNLSSQGYPETQMFYELIPWMDETECRDTWACDLVWGTGMLMKAAQPELTAAKKAEWANIRQEIKLNDADQANGYIRVWYEDSLIYSEENLTITQGGEVPINGLIFHALFGQGFDLSQGSPQSQYSYFADFEIADSCDALDQ